MLNKLNKLVEIQTKLNDLNKFNDFRIYNKNCHITLTTIPEKSSNLSSSMIFNINLNSDEELITKYLINRQYKDLYKQLIPLEVDGVNKYINKLDKDLKKADCLIKGAEYDKLLSVHETLLKKFNELNCTVENYKLQKNDADNKLNELNVYYLAEMDRLNKKFTKELAEYKKALLILLNKIDLSFINLSESEVKLFKKLTIKENN